MIKADIVKEVAKNLGLKEHDALQIVDTIIESFKEVILRNKRLEIRDFGVFQLKQRKARVGRNPKDLKSYPIPTHKAVTFKPGKRLKEIPAILADDDSGESED